MGLLPKNERIVVNTTNKKKIWIYGAPFSGKTYLANQFPDMLLLSTDGNYTQLPGGMPPHIDIKDIIRVDGRITKKQFAWDVFKETISELEKKQNDFKTIVVDLIEDTYESCRLYMYDKLGIEHESDDSFRAWDKVRTEFLSTIKRLTNLNYENIILISHEDTSKDLTKRTGDKITSIKPNLQDKAALKIAGMMDIVCRIVAEDNVRTISFKTSEVIFGGGRLNVKVNEIPCSYEELIKVYNEANGGKITPIEINNNESADRQSTSTPDMHDGNDTTGEAEPVSNEVSNRRTRTRNSNLEETAVAEPDEAETPEKPTRRSRKKVEAPVEENEINEQVNVEPNSGEVIETPTSEEQPKRRTRKKRTED